MGAFCSVPDPTARPAITLAGERYSWSHADRSGGEDACWPWTGSRTRDGYGPISLGYHRVALRGTERAHRVAWELANGPIPKGREIAHICRVRHCVNPEHLEAVTHAENMADTIGIRYLPPVAKEHWPEIRRLRRVERVPQRTVARMFKVSVATMSRIENGVGRYGEDDS